MNTDFSAGEQALGYLYQTRCALWLLLTGSEEQELILETLDDIVFEEEGMPWQLLQTKHHCKAASLTDTSPELWKTIRIWSTHIMARAIMPDSVRMTLLTTAVASDNSIAARLRAGTDRNSGSALPDLVHVAQTSKNTFLEKAFAVFLALSPTDQKALVDSIYILDQSANIDDVAHRIKDMIRVAVSREHRNGLYERVEGWWFQKVIAHLRSQSRDAIAAFEVVDKIRSIADQFRPDALPIDFLDAQPTEVDATSDNRLFVQQLRAIAIQNRRIEKAIVDYYRAFEQRSRWAREDLLIGDELGQYERKLVDEWERFTLAFVDDQPGLGQAETKLQHIGRQIYKWAELDADVRIRPSVTEPYVMRGSYHILADNRPPRVWWHPKFIERVAQLLGQRGVQ